MNNPYKALLSFIFIYGLVAEAKRTSGTTYRNTNSDNDTYYLKCPDGKGGMVPYKIDITGVTDCLTQSVLKEYFDAGCENRKMDLSLNDGVVTCNTPSTKTTRYEDENKNHDKSFEEKVCEDTKKFDKECVAEAWKVTGIVFGSIFACICLCACAAGAVVGTKVFGPEIKEKVKESLSCC